MTDEVKELDRDDPSLVAPAPPETENEQKKSEFRTVTTTEAHRAQDTSPGITQQREKAERQAAREADKG